MTHAFISFKVANQDVSQGIKVSFEEHKLTLEYKGEKQVEIELANAILPEACTTEAKPRLLEIKLKKKDESINWMALAKGEKGNLMATSVPAAGAPPPSYPTSSKSKKNWDQIDKEIKKDMETEKPEGDEALNSLFKQIYERADEDTRRAMIKSYQTSGGTVLSTNWDEVAAKDYEGKDRPDPPEGQKWAGKE